eukprot:3390020-Rhodomonas_salina.1
MENFAHPFRGLCNSLYIHRDHLTRVITRVSLGEALVPQLFVPRVQQTFDIQFCRNFARGLAGAHVAAV